MSYNWNTTEKSWGDVVAAFETTIKQIVRKTTKSHFGHAEDCAQSARIDLWCVNPKNIKGYQEHIHGPITASNVNSVADGAVSRYMRNVIRNSILSELTNKNTKPWFAGTSSRFVSVEDLTEAGLELDTNGELSPMRLASGDVNVLY